MVVVVAAAASVVVVTVRADVRVGSVADEVVAVVMLVLL